MKHSNPNPTSDRPLFALGKVSATPGALDAITEAHGERWKVALQKLLARHLRCEQGELTPCDHAANLEAVSNKTRIFSSFRLPTTIPGKLGVKLWIITEADRSCTTILLPDEY